MTYRLRDVTDPSVPFINSHLNWCSSEGSAGQYESWEDAKSAPRSSSECPITSRSAVAEDCTPTAFEQFHPQQGDLLIVELEPRNTRDMTEAQAQAREMLDYVLSIGRSVLPEPEDDFTVAETLINRTQSWQVGGATITVVEGDERMTLTPMPGVEWDLTADEADALSLALLEAREELR